MYWGLTMYKTPLQGKKRERTGGTRWDWRWVNINFFSYSNMYHNSPSLNFTWVIRPCPYPLLPCGSSRKVTRGFSQWIISEKEVWKDLWSQKQIQKRKKTLSMEHPWLRIPGRAVTSALRDPSFCYTASPTQSPTDRLLVRWELRRGEQWVLHAGQNQAAPARARKVVETDLAAKRIATTPPRWGAGAAKWVTS